MNFKYYQKIRRAIFFKQRKHMADLNPKFKIVNAEKDDYQQIFWNKQVVGTIKSNHAIQDSYKGACYIVGTGPSVADIDLSLIQHADTMGVNGSILKFAEYNIKPTHYVMTDPDFFANRFSLVEQVVKTNANCFFSASGLSKICEIDESILKHANLYLLEVVNRIYNKKILDPMIFYKTAQQDPDFVLPQHIHDQEGRIGFSRNINKGVFCSRTILYRAIQVAYYLGYRTIFLLGMDLNSSLPKTRFYETGSDARPSKLDKDYEPYILPSFEILRSVCQTEQLAVYNLSLNSRLPTEIIPKMSFAESRSMR